MLVTVARETKAKMPQPLSKTPRAKTTVLRKLWQSRVKLYLVEKMHPPFSFHSVIFTSAFPVGGGRRGRINF